MGGFIVPYTVPDGAFWKLAQALPGDILNFVKVSVDEAQATGAQAERGLQRGLHRGSLVGLHAARSVVLGAKS